MENKTKNIFEDFGFLYDKMIKWEKRLDNERPFFKDIVESGSVRSLLDVGCGTGHHGILFAKMGVAVTAVDPSQEMLEEARLNSSHAGVEIKFQHAGIGQLDSLGAKFDMITCLGNTLAYVRDLSALEQALKEFYDCLEPKGLLTIQMRNYDKVFLNKERYMPLNSFSDGNRDILFLRMTEFISEMQVQFNILVFHREEGQDWQFRVYPEILTPWRGGQLIEALKQQGFKNINSYGDYKKAPWEEQTSNDVIITAEK